MYISIFEVFPNRNVLREFKEFLKLNFNEYIFGTPISVAGK